MKIIPIGRRLLVQQIPLEKSQAGLHLPQTYSDEFANQYRVLEVGVKCDPVLKSGMIAILHSQRGAVGNVREPQLIDERQILAVLE